MIYVKAERGRRPPGVLGAAVSIAQATGGVAEIGHESKPEFELAPGLFAFRGIDNFIGFAKDLQTVNPRIIRTVVGNCGGDAGHKFLPFLKHTAVRP